MNTQDTARILALIVSVYQNLAVTDDTVAIWSLVMADQEAEKVQAALVEYLRGNHPFPPKPGELIERAKPPGGDGSPLAEEAWGEVRRAISEVGYTGTPKWSHPRIERAVRAVLGDWLTYCQTAETDHMIADRARFIQAYSSIGARDSRVRDQGEAAALISGGVVLPGLAEHVRGIGE